MGSYLSMYSKSCPYYYMVLKGEHLMKEFFKKYWTNLTNLFKSMVIELTYESLPIIYIGECQEIPDSEWIQIVAAYEV